MFIKAQKIASLFLLFMIFSSSVFAQVAGGKFDKLFDLYVLGDFEKCLMKAQKEADKEKNKSESEPYIYMSMCYIKISEDPDLNTLDYYKGAKKDGIKAGAKFVKKDLKRKDKGKDYLYDDNFDYIQSLKQIAIEEGKAELAQNDYRKAVYYYKLAVQLDENDPATLLIKGTCDLLSKNRREGTENVANALEKYKEIAKAGAYEPAREVEMAFQDGFIYYANYLIDNNQLGEAQEVMELARTLAPENKTFTQKLKQITG